MQVRESETQVYCRTSNRRTQTIGPPLRDGMSQTDPTEGRCIHCGKRKQSPIPMDVDEVINDAAVSETDSWDTDSLPDPTDPDWVLPDDHTEADDDDADMMKLTTLETTMAR